MNQRIDIQTLEQQIARKQETLARLQASIDEMKSQLAELRKTEVSQKGRLNGSTQGFSLMR
ncbi:MAG TPA: hypothetical protein VEL31_26620 [Ktedonobacteraceae bacterium]|nr:hypothetical protein [Ktedonobacteraceae bacterium]